MSGVKEKVLVRNLTLGDGIPKICVPVTAHDKAELMEQIGRMKGSPCDLVELRADFFDGDPIEALAILRRELPEMPVLFTFRTKEEGGEKQISMEEYAALNRRAAGLSSLKDEEIMGREAISHGGSAGNLTHCPSFLRADLIDLEVNRGEKFLQDLCRELQKAEVRVIASFHDFEKTPDRDTLIGLLCRMQELGADVTKAAVMPRSEQDVLELLEAAVAMKHQHADRPYIVMSMGRLGGISRLAGALTGSAVTFATAGNASAPGQLDAALVALVLDVLQTEHA
ncbi:MAG: type I 3-dehydroquinate dehydratase [Lachnospiraceae bacterium]|nr:type I 3-dehydroquinate dehydratase [Lachnospiraceae bacterium]